MKPVDAHAPSALKNNLFWSFDSFEWNRKTKDFSGAMGRQSLNARAAFDCRQSACEFRPHSRARDTS